MKTGADTTGANGLGGNAAGTNAAGARLAQDTAANVIAGTGRRALADPDQTTTVVLPEGATLDDLRVDGDNLIVALPDGTQMVIVDGAIYDLLNGIAPQLDTGVVDHRRNELGGSARLRALNQFKCQSPRSWVVALVSEEFLQVINGQFFPARGLRASFVPFSWLPSDTQTYAHTYYLLPRADGRTAGPDAVRQK